MRFYLLDTPKINLKYDSKDNGKIAAFFLIYLSPLMLLLFRIDNDDLFIYIECFYYLLVMYMAERVIFQERKKNFRCIKKRVKKYAKLFFVSITHCIGILIILSIISEKMSDGVSENQESIYEIPLLIQLILVLIYAPVVEEVLFRHMFRRLIKREGAYIIVSGVVFGIVHVISSIGSHRIIDVIAYSLPHLGVGLYLSYIYASTNSIETCIIIHRVLNLFAILPLILIYLYKYN